MNNKELGEIEMATREEMIAELVEIHNKLMSEEDNPRFKRLEVYIPMLLFLSGTALFFLSQGRKVTTPLGETLKDIFTNMSIELIGAFFLFFIFGRFFLILKLYATGRRKYIPILFIGVIFLLLIPYMLYLGYGMPEPLYIDIRILFRGIASELLGALVLLVSLEQLTKTLEAKGDLIDRSNLLLDKLQIELE